MFLATLALTLPLLVSMQAPQSALASTASSTARSSSTASPARLPVYVILVNMSGNAREVRVGTSRISLPVGQRVPLTVHNGEALAVTSATDSKVDRTLLVQTADNGRTIGVR